MSHHILTKFGETRSLVSIDQTSKNNLINITTCKPFSFTKNIYKIQEGFNIVDICKKSNIDYNYAHIYVNDIYIKKENYEITYPKANDIIIIREFAGKGDDKNVLDTILRIVVIIAAAYVGYYWGQAWGAATYFVGNLAVSTLIPPPTAKIQAPTVTGFSVDQTYSIVGTNNQILPFGTVPRILGRARIYPPRAALPYTQISGNDQYVYELYCLGPGPLDKSNLKIGENIIDNYEGVEYEFLVGNESSTIYSNDDAVVQKDINILLPNYNTYADSILPYFDDATTPWIVQTTEPNTKSIQIDLTCPSGLFFTWESDGKNYSIVTLFRIQVYVSGSWSDISPQYGYVITTDGQCSMKSYADGDFHPGGNILAISGNGPSLVRGSVKWDMDTPDQYDVRIRPIIQFGPYTGSAYDHDEIYWTALRSFIDQSGNDSDNVGPQNQLIEFVALKIKATDQLNGYVDTFNLVCQAHHPVYTGDNWVTKATRNNAWCFAEVLTGSSNKKAISTSRLNQNNLLEFAQFCDTKGFECNGVLTGKAPVREILKQITSIAMGAPGMIDEKYGVIIDEEKSTPIQIFTPRNSWNYSATKIFSDLPHAVRCKFVDENGQPDEVMAYDDGYDSTNATEFEILELSFVNNYEQAWKLGRYYLAAAKLRPEIHKIDVDFEHIVCTRGDLIGLAHDAPSIGSGWCRIKSKTVDGTDVTLVLDDYITMSAGTDYGIIIRTNTVPISCQIDTNDGEHKTITCTLPTASSSLIEVDNLIVWGELNSEYSLMIVKEIIPMSDLSATIYLIDYNENILNADSGTIPDWSSNITYPVYEDVPQPIIENVVSDESAMFYNSGGTLVNGINVAFTRPTVTGLNQPVGLEVQYRLYDDGSDSYVWQASTVYNLNETIRPSRNVTPLLEVQDSLLSIYSSNNELELLNKVVLKIFSNYLANYINNENIEIDSEVLLNIIDSVIDNITENISLDTDYCWYLCVDAGTSDASEPTWTSNIGDSILDNDITWLCLGDIEFSGKWEDLKGISADDSIFKIPNVMAGGKYQIRIRFIDDRFRRGEWTYINHTVVGGTADPDTPSGLSSDNFINGIKFYWSESGAIDFSHWEYRIQVESEGWSSWKRVDTVEYTKYLDRTQIELYDYEATIYLELKAYDIFGNNSTAAAYNAKTGLLNNYPLTFTVSTSTNKGDYTSIQDALDNLSTANKQAVFIKNGTYNLSTFLNIPDQNFDLFGQSIGGVNIVASTTMYTILKFHNLKKSIRLSNLTLKLTAPTSIEPSSYFSDGMVYVDGDASSDNELELQVSNVNFDFSSNRNGYGILGKNGIGEGRINVLECYFYNGYTCIGLRDYDNIFINNNLGEDVNFLLRYLNTSSQASRYNQIIGNKITYNVRGADIIYGSNISLISNHFIYNTSRPSFYSVIDPNYGIKIGYSNNINISNNIVDIVSTSTIPKFIRGIYSDYSNYCQISNNTINMDISSKSSQDGLYAIGGIILGNQFYNGQVSNNIINNNISTTLGSTNFGIYIRDDRNVIQGNNIDLNNNTAREVGIRLSLYSANNQGGDNLTYRCGVSVNDLGSSNAVTAKDV